MPLETIDGTYYHFKADILSGQITYSTDKRMAANLVTVSAERALEVMEMTAAVRSPKRSTTGCTTHREKGGGPRRTRRFDTFRQVEKAQKSVVPVLTMHDRQRRKKDRKWALPTHAAAMLDVNARPVATTTANRERSGNRNDRNRNSRDAEARADQAKGNGRRDQTRPTPNGNSDNTPTA